MVKSNNTSVIKNNLNSKWTNKVTDQDKSPLPTPDKKLANTWPKTTLCILGNELCERFSYYGLRSVLMLYLLNQLHFSKDVATMLLCGVTVLCYVTPVFGSILADGYIGKFKTILFLSMFYTAGQVLLAFASAESHLPWLSLAALAIIGIGAGGIKPCVCPFGADQFESHQGKMLSIYFSAFYFAINSGSMISTFTTPMLRATPCMGQVSCFPLAFGLPAVLMVLAIILFISGSFWYKKAPPKENVFGEIFVVTKKAIANRWSSMFTRSHWLDYYFDNHQCANDPRCRVLQFLQKDAVNCHKRKFIADLKSFFRLVIILLPAPMFWALYDQQGNRWMIQAVAMDCRIWGDWLLLPDQMHALNAVLILVFIPIFTGAIYPAASVCVKITPLRKMVAGGLVAALAFVMSAAVQFRINQDLPLLPTSNQSFVSAINAHPDNCPIRICNSLNSTQQSQQCHSLLPNQKLSNLNAIQMPVGRQTWEVAFENDDQKKCSLAGKKWLAEWNLEGGKSYWMLVNGQGISFGKASMRKPTDGVGEFSLGITLAMVDNYYGNLALCRKQSGKTTCDSKNAKNFYVWNASTELINTEQYQGDTVENKNDLKASIYAYKTVRSGNWILYYLNMVNGKLHFNDTGIEIPMIAQGGVYMLALTGDKIKPTKHLLQLVADNSMSILWQIPQIATITAAEILFSITGNEFAYSQVAPSMKTVAQAVWLLTTAVGDAIIVLITLLKFPNMAHEFLFYAGSMFVVSVVLALMAIFYYDYNYYTGEQMVQNRSDNAEKKNSSDFVIE